jgi:hypothetical protein
MVGKFTTILSTQKAPTRGGSPARHTRAQRYCYCDEAYQMLDTLRKSNLVPWWKKVSEKPIVSMSTHSILMKICLKYLEEFTQYRFFSWVSRYRVTNTDDVEWIHKVVTFYDIPCVRSDGEDCEAFLLLNATTKKGSITYDSKMIDKRLERDIVEKGIADVIIPKLAPQQSCWVDIYSWDSKVIQ